MKNKVTAEDIVKLMGENDITIQDVSRAMNCESWIWCLDDFICDLKDRNEKYGIEMTEEQELDIAKRAFAKFEIADCVGDLGYTMMHEAINQLLEDAIEEVENN